MATSLVSLIIILIINLPQIVAAVIILSLYWSNSTTCTETWNWWSLISAIRMSLYSIIVVIMYSMRLQIHTQRMGRYLQTTRKYLDMFALVW
jgi:hypothetical protein